MRHTLFVVTVKWLKSVLKLKPGFRFQTILLSLGGYSQEFSASLGAHHKTNEDRLTLSVAKCGSNESTFWRYKVYPDIHGGSLGRGVKRRWGCRQRQFSAFSLAVSSETLEIRPTAVYSHMQCSSSAFQWSENAWHWMTLNGYVALKSVFFLCRLVWLSMTVRLSKIFAWKLIKIDTE